MATSTHDMHLSAQILVLRVPVQLEQQRAVSSVVIINQLKDIGLKIF